ncbi:S8 family serine peptidase, partial [candidate division WOR-3 bacterium]|nr:S8 family serine peptidase [candidate division WOR-3 bacterium]
MKTTVLMLAALAATPGAAEFTVRETPEPHIAGRAIVELVPELRGRVRLSEADGIAFFGVPALDEISVRRGIEEVAPLMRHPELSEVARRYGCDLQYLVRFSEDREVAPVLADYLASGLVTDACPDAWLELTEVPNDSFYGNQWHLERIGAPIAWNIHKGDSAVLIGVLDDGCEWHHPDIEPNLWVNHPEDANGNGRFDSLDYPEGDVDGMDQDGNGYADDVIGFDLAGGDPNPVPFVYTDDHGTHCWGIANAVTDNDRGVAAPPWNCRSFAFRCGGLGGISLSAAIAGIYYVVPLGGFVISMSFGGYSQYTPMRDACQYAWDSGCILVGGAGNDGTTNRFYPADYPSVISVAASGPADLKTSWSNYGDWIEITAPGSGIYATVTRHAYGTKDGTSMATPLVAGVAAWIKSAFPTMNNAQVCSLMYQAAEPMPDPLYAQGKLGAGRVSMANVVLPLYYCDLRLTDWRFNDASGNSNGRPDPGETAALIATYFNTAGWQNATSITATLTCATPEVEILKGTAGFPNIPAGSGANCSNDSFVVRVPASMPPQELEFRLTVAATPNPAYPDTS